MFVYGNDIYYLDSPSSDKVERLTDSGVEHKIFNGVPDWVYQGKGKLKVSVRATGSFSQRKFC